MSFLGELKRRNVFRVGIAYVVVAWVILQAIDFGLDIISAPNWVMQVFFLAGVAGLPVVLVFAWVFEMTPQGLKRESEVDPGLSITRVTGQKLDRTIITFLAFAVVLLLGERFVMQENSPAPAPPAEVVTAKTKTTVAATGSRLRSVAVLPFVNMSSDPEQEYFSDGLSEELLNRLAQNDQLRVAARTSSFQFKGQNQDIGEIGRQLKVDNVLEGSVRKAANRLRITAQLIRVDSGYHLWSETYEREIDDVFAIQDDIALAITSALEAELGAVSTSSDTRPTDNLEAYQLYLQARYLLAKRGEANMLKAHDLFEQAVTLDPAFSKAWSGLAYNYALLPAYGATISPRQAWNRIRVATAKAIELDPTNAEAYTALARGNIGDDYKTIQALYEKAYELAPNNTDVVNLYGDFLVVIGDFTSAERMEQKAIDLDPLAAVHYSDMAFLMFMTGRIEEGLNFGRTSANLEPGSVVRVDPLVTGLMLTGEYDEAIQMIRHFEQGPEAYADLTNWWWCLLYYQQGEERKLRERLAYRMEDYSSGRKEFDFVQTAFFIAWLDGPTAALPMLREAYEENEWLLAWPEYFYLPQQYSDDLEWLSFWQQPPLGELIELRRGHQPLERVGYWKDRLTP